MASSNVFGILSLILSSDAPKLPENLVAGSLRVRHEFLDLQPDMIAYYQLATTKPSTDVHAKLERIRESGEWELDTLCFHFGCREEPDLPEMLARTTVFSANDRQSALDVVFALENAESATTEPLQQGDWKFLTLLEVATPFPTSLAQWYESQEVAAQAFETAPQLAHDESAEDYWGESEGNIVEAAAIEYDNDALEQDYWTKYDGDPATNAASQSSAVEIPTGVDSRFKAGSTTANRRSEEVSALEKSLDGILELWLGNCDSSNTEMSLQRLRLFQKIAENVVDDRILQITGENDQ